MLNLVRHQGWQDIRSTCKRNDQNECLIPFKWCGRAVVDGAGAGAAAFKFQLIGEEDGCCDLKTGEPTFSREVYRRDVINFGVFQVKKYWNCAWTLFSRESNLDEYEGGLDRLVQELGWWTLFWNGDAYGVILDSP